MNKEQLEAELEKVAEIANNSDQKAVAAIIYSLLGAMKCDNENELLGFVTLYAENKLKQFAVARNMLSKN